MQTKDFNVIKEPVKKRKEAQISKGLPLNYSSNDRYKIRDTFKLMIDSNVQNFGFDVHCPPSKSYLKMKSPATSESLDKKSTGVSKNSKSSRKIEKKFSLGPNQRFFQNQRKTRAQKRTYPIKESNDIEKYQEIKLE